MHVLYLNYEWDLAESIGAATHMAELTRCLRSMGHRVTTHDRHRTAVQSGGLKTTHCSDRRRAFHTWLSSYLHEFAALARSIRGIAIETALIRRARPDVVLTRHTLHPFSSLIAARHCDTPIVFEVNAPAGFEYRRYRPEYRLIPGFVEFTEARTLALTDAVFVVSKSLKAHLVSRRVPPERITVIPNGADTALFRPDAVTPAIRRQIGPEKVVVGFVGSFASFHGIDLLQRAIERICPIRPNVVFLMVGKGRMAIELERFCHSQSFGQRVVFTGFVPRAEVPGVVAATDVLLAPYPPQEFFYFSPIKLFEYMAAGRAVLAARLGQIAEVIDHGRNGLLYDPTVTGSFEDNVLRLVDDSALRTRLGLAARETIQRHYTWRVNAEHVADLLQDTIARYGAKKPGAAPPHARILS